MSDDREHNTTEEVEEKDDEAKVIDPDLILGDEVALEDEELEEEVDEEDEEGLDETDINPFGDKWEE